MALLVAALLINLALSSAQSPQYEVYSSGPDLESGVLFGVEKPFKLSEGKSQEVPFITTIDGVYTARISNEDQSFATVSNFKYELVSSSFNVPSYNFFNDTEKETVTAFGTFNVSGHFIGYSTVTITLYDVNDQMIGTGQLKVNVLLSNVLWTQIYTIGFSISLVILYLNMGVCLDIDVLKQIVKRPIGPAIGLGCQYICMPMIAYGLGLWAFPDNTLLRLGLFASGSSPGGGLSNMWTHLLGGSLDLSIMMTFVSTVAALGMVPLWLLTLGRVILEGEYHIPYLNVVVGIFILIVPVFIGLAIQVYFPRVVSFMRRLVTPVSMFNIAFILTVGVYANLYMFSYMTWKILLVAFGQSLCGHIVGLVIALMFRRNTKDVIAISIETAVQNNGVALVFLKISIDAPAGDIAAVLPGCVFLLMPFTLLTALLIKKIYIWRKNSKTSFLQDTRNLDYSSTSVPKGGSEDPSTKNESRGIDNFAYTNNS